MNRLAEEYYENVVRIEDDEAKCNELITMSFVNGFTRYLWNEKKLKVSFFGQGSAFEGLKVRKADEFDFLLVLATSDRFGWEWQKKSIREYLHQNAPDEEPNLKVIILKDQIRKSNQLFTSMTELWPGTQIRCLSAAAVMHVFQEQLKLFRQKWTNGAYPLPGIIKIESPKLGTCALTIKLHKTDGSIISVDISVSVRRSRNHKNDEETISILEKSKYHHFRYYIAKKNTNSQMDERLGMLWLVTYMSDEMTLIWQKTEAQRKNYRIVKSMLLESLNNSYIPKIVFMGWTRIPDNFAEFLLQMLRSLEGAYCAELVRRDMKPMGNFSGCLMMNHFNPKENVLARFKGGRIQSQYAFLSQVHEKMLSRCKCCLGQALHSLFVGIPHALIYIYVQSLYDHVPDCVKCHEPIIDPNIVQSKEDSNRLILDVRNLDVNGINKEIDLYPELRELYAWCK